MGEHHGAMHVTVIQCDSGQAIFYAAQDIFEEADLNNDGVVCLRFSLMLFKLR